MADWNAPGSLYEGRPLESAEQSVARIARVLTCVDKAFMVLLHGFIKKSQQTPDQELDLAVKRKKEIENDGKTKE